MCTPDAIDCSTTTRESHGIEIRIRTDLNDVLEIFASPAVFHSRGWSRWTQSAIELIFILVGRKTSTSNADHAFDLAKIKSFKSFKASCRCCGEDIKCVRFRVDVLVRNSFTFYSQCPSSYSSKSSAFSAVSSSLATSSSPSIS